MKAWRKASTDLDKEYRKAEATVYNATILCLYRDYGFRKNRLERFLEKANEVYEECAGSRKKSLVQMCDEQLGIELRNDDNETYLDTPYLCEEDWDNKKKQVLNKMNAMQQRCYLIEVRRKMAKWMFPQVMASILLALNKKESWGPARASEFAYKVQAIREEFGNDIKKLKAAVIEETGLDYVWINGKVHIISKEDAEILKERQKK